MQRTTTFSRLGQTLIAATRGFCTSTSKSGGDEKILASVLFERLPVVVSKIDPVVYAFQEFSFRWGQQYRREYPEALLKKSDARYFLSGRFALVCFLFIILFFSGTLVLFHIQHC
ncbi:hypothetical protein ACS0TY_019303 [Phlomoides rotata]